MGDFQKIFEMFNLDVETTGALIAFVMLLLAAIKKWVPAIHGKISVAVAAGFSILFSAKAYWTASISGGVDIFAMIMSSIFVFLGSIGVFELIKKTGGNQ